MFYEHVETMETNVKFELQWIDQSWRFRFIPYQGEWIQVDSPMSVPGISVADLEYFLTHHLLTHYAYYKTTGEMTLNMKRIERLFGTIVCQKAVDDLVSFSETLASAISAALKSPSTTPLRIVE
jgi:hypothetical protein